ncbi:hypothetical protein QBC37DRAFT_324235 [Rhypophila decipiens]|uniref:Rhodopsin domain-containing protein n=1 Tax=Rhypophila decipiens TaxID=261697 RepID=A0AAN7B422_9PEZI|nr:hypothetical protein QBC37DRAFT_324235 [Rhypophila decipiens]
MNNSYFIGMNLGDQALKPEDAGGNLFNPAECSDHSLGYAVVISGTIISTLSLIVRLSSSYMRKKLGVPDGLLVLAWMQYMAFSIVLWLGAAQRGLPCHQWNYTVGDLNKLLEYVHMLCIIYAPCMICLKSAILVDWMYLFCPAGRDRMWWVIQVMIWGNIIFYVVGAFAEAFQCTPSRRIYDVLYDDPDANCGLNIEANNFSGSLINLVSDVAILALPNWRVWRMSSNVTWKKKLGISILFLTGIIVCVFGAMRLIGLAPLMPKPDNNGNLTEPDMTYYISLVGIYSGLELGFGFLILALPATPLVVKKIPVPESLISMARTITDTCSRRWTGRAGARHSTAPTCPHPGQGPEATKKRYRGVWSIPELEETQPGGTKLADLKRDSSTSSDSYTTTPSTSKSERDFKLYETDRPFDAEDRKVTGSDLV